MSADNYPELLTDLKTTVTASLVADGINQAKAEQYAHTAAERIRNEWGGAMVYIPKGKEFELSARDLEIWSKFKKGNYLQLAREYDISIQWVYKIIKYQQAAELKRRQADMFD